MILSETPRIELLNMDCMTFMATCKDKQYSLAIVDPPYGIDNQRGGGRTVGSGWKRHVVKDWDLEIPKKQYFTELFRISQNQIIWGANYFTKYLAGSMGWVVWDKQMDNFSTSDSELAFTSFRCKLKNFRFAPGAERGVMAIGGNIHPTQKPIRLYSWLLTNYAKPGDTIFDSHGGSFSSAIAAYRLGFDFTGIELDKDYFEAAVKRFKEQTAQMSMFKPVEKDTSIQTTLL